MKPQHLLADIILTSYDNRVITSYVLDKKLHNGEQVTRVYIVKDIDWAISLGEYIITHEHPTVQTLRHEYGHTLQARKWGILYLITVGIPSIVFNILTRMKILPGNTYYKRYPENEADILGGVKRK